MRQWTQGAFIIQNKNWNVTHTKGRYAVVLNNRRYLQHCWLYCATRPVSTFPPACSRRRLPSAALCEVYRVTIIRPGSLIKLIVVIALRCLSIMHLRQYGIKNTNNPTKGRLLHQNAYSIHPFNCSPSIKPCLAALVTTTIATQQHDCGMILRTEDTCTEKPLHCGYGMVG